MPPPRAFPRVMSQTTRPDPAADAEAGEAEITAAQRVIASSRFRVRDVTLVILTVLAVFYTLYFAASIILPIAFALVFALLLSPVMRLLTGRLRLPRMLAAILLIVLLFSVIGGIAYAVSVPAANWIAKAPQSLPVLQKKLSFLAGPLDYFQHGMGQMAHLLHPGGQGGQPPQTVAVQQSTPGASMGLTVLSGTRAVLGQTLTLVVVLFFLLADGDTLLRRFIEILPGFAEKKRAVQIATAVERNISGYLATITVMNAIVGAANALSVWAWGLPNPLLWGTAAFLLNYVPILGPLTGMVTFFVIGLFSFNSVWLALGPPAVYLLIHIAEGETITPMLLARRFTLNPLLVIVALMFWDWLWGVPGALLAVPLLAVAKILCDHIEALTPVGHLLGAERVRPRP